MNLVALVLLADAVGPREQVHDIGVRLNVCQLKRIVAGYFSAVENPLAQFGNTFPYRRHFCGNR